MEDFGQYHVVLSRNRKGWVHDMAHRRLYVSLILLLFNLSMSGCQSAKQVSLDWAGGDIVTGAATVILAMGAGRNAATAIDRFLAGR